MPPLMGKAHWLAAAATYLAAALFSLRVVLPEPRVRLPYSVHLTGMHLAIDAADQQFVVASIARAARAVVRGPAGLFDNLQCYPMARSATLGEHMLGEGLLGALPALAVDDPIFVYNAVLLLGIWIAGLTMYALVRYWTASTGAALVAGLLFAVQPGRLGDPTHPFVHGDLWSPLVLLATHVLFVRRTWAATAALAVAVALVLCESLYAILGLVLVAVVYVPYLLAVFRHRLPALVPKLVVAAGVMGAVAAGIFTPYLHTREVWGVLEGRPALHLPPEQFLPGAFYYPGTVVVALAALALFDRVRGPRPGAQGYDPRLVYFVAALLIAWSVVSAVPVPGTGIAVPSPLAWLREWVPGLEAVRAVPAIRTGAYLCLIFLAGWGAQVVLRPFGGAARAAITAALLAAGSLETFHPTWSRISLGVSPVPMGVRRAAPFPAVRALGASLPEGAVLDLPFRVDPLSRLAPMAHYIFLGAYHGRPVAACYNSFTVPIMEQTAALAERLPDPAALAALHALGYRSVVTHDELLGPAARTTLRAALAAPPAGSLRLVPAGAAGPHRAFRIEGEQPITTDARVLEGAAGGVQTIAAATRAPVRVRFRNAGPDTFRLPDPVEPSDLVATWRAAPAGPVTAEPVRVLLPMALAGGAVQEEAIELLAPAAAGRYLVEVALADAPGRVVGRATVEVGG